MATSPMTADHMSSDYMTSDHRGATKGDAMKAKKPNKAKTGAMMSNNTDADTMSADKPK
jgi:hypothetical protein